MKKVLYIGSPSILLYTFSFRKAIVEAGYEVIDPEYLNAPEPGPITRRFREKEYYKEVYSKQNTMYINAAKFSKPDFVFVINNDGVDSTFLEYCKNNKIPLFLYCMDSIRWCDNALECMRYYDDIYSYEPSDTKVEFRPGHFVKFVPIGFDKDIYKPNDKLTKQKYDICFVGRLDKRRLAILEKVAEYANNNDKSMIVYTSIQLLKIPHFWLIPKLIARRIRYNIKYKNLMKYIVNEPIIGKDLTDLYNNSRLCLNIHVGTHEGMHTGPNPRTFELLGCRSFEMIDSGHIGLTNLESGKDIVEFSDENDMLKKIDYYLNNDSERNKIAENGFIKASEYYRLDVLVHQILFNIEKIVGDFDI